MTNSKYEKKMVYITEDSTWETDIAQRSSIVDIGECLETIKSKYGDGVDISFEVYDHDYVTTTFRVKRLETDVEFERRVNTIKQQEDREQKEYLRLKAKFEGEVKS